MERLLSTFPPYSVCAPPAQDGGWLKRDGRFITPQGLNYLELCKAIISQVGPGVPPAFKRALTKECGVQVNAKVDKVVQCSLGPKTLLCSEGDHHACYRSPEPPTPPCHTPPVSNLRFLRPVSIYSPVFDRRIHLRKLCSDGDGGSEGEAEQAESDKDAETDQSGEDTVKDWRTAFRRSSKGSNFQVTPKRLPTILLCNTRQYEGRGTQYLQGTTMSPFPSSSL